MEFIGPKTKEEINDFLKTRIKSLDFSTRTENALVNASILTIRGIVRKRGQSLLEVDGIGLRGIEEIKKELSGIFDVKIVGKDFKFIPRYFEVNDIFSITDSKEQTEGERIENGNLKKEIKIIEEKYFEKQKEKEFIYQIKIVSLGIDSEIETTLLKNNIITVGVLLEETIESLKEGYSLDNKEINSILDIFNYLVLKNKQIEKEQEEIRMKVFDLIGYLPRVLEKKQSIFTEKNLKMNSRDLNILKLFRDGLTLNQIGKENNISRERVRQILLKILDKVGLNYKEERRILSEKREKLKLKKIKKEKTWSRNYTECISCKTTNVPHYKNGLCNICGNKSISGEMREKWIKEHNNICDICNDSREESFRKYKRDFYLSRKRKSVLCKKCHMFITGKKLGDYKKINGNFFIKINYLF